jgi:hypothetical protein
MKRLSSFATLLSTLCITLTLVFSACGSADTNTLPAQVAQAAPIATSTPIPPTATATVQPTATLAAVITAEWAVVKGTGAEVKAEPRSSSDTVERLAGFTVLALQRKLIDETWLERAGGGWVAKNDVIIYRNEAEARRNVPQATSAPTPVPTYNPNQPPTANPALVKQQIEATAGAAEAARQATIEAAKPKPTATKTPPPPAAPAQAPASSGGSGGSGSGSNSGIYLSPGTGSAVVCNDGSISTSGGKQGACSHHGGVRK